MTRFRVGIMDPLIAARPAVDTFTRANYLSAVAGRVDSLWVPDHLNALFPRSLWQPKFCGGAKMLPSADAYLETWTMLGNLAARNRVARRTLGVSVTDTGRRNPAVTAQAAATMNLLTKGRFILGVGTGEREGNEPYGVDWAKPVARFEEAMATIRALWDSKGQLVNRDSPFFPLRNAIFDLPAYRGRWPEIWIAGHGPRMLRATGRYADGFFPAFAHTPQEYAQRLDVVRSAASDAGRDPMAITPALWCMVVPGRNRADVDEALESEVIKAGALIAPDDFYARHGAQHPLVWVSRVRRTSCRRTGTNRPRCPTSSRFRCRCCARCTSAGRPPRSSNRRLRGATTVSGTW
ncbi:phthiodiolone/phenolphthiodiolone dimycocerosates ketoreductase [Mycolicibacterium lutetiense]|uniref:Phthiodiolone/phenolphthiodiolone dimycocerosates ketoreductase n=1 Tax=Mycolicibacterium lutetiense TaxID=1641992 RepID=A0ABS4ZXU3_9MYCO|nr:phthiodiolone/phenolphthiodiolone dimycocerosates ketoreductase [Mycolicibacterium lutetiense]